MAIKKSLVEFEHDEGYGDRLVESINQSISGKDMRAIAANPKPPPNPFYEMRFHFCGLDLVVPAPGGVVQDPDSMKRFLQMAIEQIDRLSNSKGNE